MKKKDTPARPCLVGNRKLMLGLAAGLAVVMLVAELPEMVRYCRMMRL
jgi:hypothetical protein